LALLLPAQSSSTYRKTIMKCGQFETLTDAIAYRKNHGGWIFLTEFNEAFWFNSEYTPTRILLHRLTKGLSGKLI
jgi:hypothetical protein